jgi:hypothetical protein
VRCIFCKADSQSARSVEHILPESLGNIDHTLPVGAVCDWCNEYFGRKIEGPILESGIFRLLRADRRVENKEGRLPILDNRHVPNLPDYRLMSRFIGKVGLEALAHRVNHITDWNAEIVNKTELDPIREYVRFNRGKITWPFAYRTLYPVNTLFNDGQEYYDVPHEFDLLYTEGKELYIVLVIFGVEFALNLGGPELDGYDKWLTEHDFASPLYTGKNS